MISAARIRQEFIEFFEAKDHKFVPSSPVVPFDDPTLLFANAGMNQFKAAFLGAVPAGSPLEGLKRAVNSQKCIRAGGKHNDLEDVGLDVYHHTFFEMLGNWSFGDFFKKEAIDWAWELLVKVWKVDSSRLYATYFEGGEGCPCDTEARDLWLQYLPEERVIPFGFKDNFWEMGSTGPCGPCSEIHFDRIGNRDASPYVNMDDPNVLEIWNLVFMQFDRQEDGSLVPLPKPSVDTGMGLERIASVLNSTPSNYLTDAFTPIFKRLKHIMSHIPDYEDSLESQTDIAYRVISDHIRSVSFAIADGATPSSEGRGYVIRRILRRAVRIGRQYLDAPVDVPWFAGLSDTVVQEFGHAFPSLEDNKTKIFTIIKKEEIMFARTLDRGIQMFQKAVFKLGGARVISGEAVFDLYTTYGFPIDLTRVMALEKKLDIDEEGFTKMFEAHKRVSDSWGVKRRECGVNLSADQLYEMEGLEPTDDKGKYVWSPINGFGPLQLGNVTAIYRNGELVKSVTEVGDIAVALDKTNFYCDAGGQIGDSGVLVDKNVDITVTDCRRIGKHVFHIGKLNRGSLKVGEEIKAIPDFEKRCFIAKNHTATHLLNFALRKVLKVSCDQKGSLVDNERLRFDFEYDVPLTDKELDEVQECIVSIIKREIPVDADEQPLSEAKEIKGLRSVFGEAYPDPVRVVAVGGGRDALDASVEFCGGTHVGGTHELEDFVILSEESIGKSIRRIVAVTGPMAVVTHETTDKLWKSPNRNLQNYEAWAEELNETNQIEISARKKMRIEIEGFANEKKEEGKKRTKGLIRKGGEIGVQLASEEEEVVVRGIDSLEFEGKAIESLMTEFAKAAPTKRLFVAYLHQGKIQAAACGAGSKALMEKALQAVGGKGGGRENAAKGVVDDASEDTLLNILKKAKEVIL